MFSTSNGDNPIIAEKWSPKYERVLRQIQTNAFISRIIVYESALSLKKWGKFFKWPPILLLSVPVTIESYNAAYSTKWWAKIISVSAIFLSASLKSWHQSREYDTRIERFRNTSNELSRIIDEISFTLAKENNDPNKQLPNEFIQKIIAQFAQIRKELPMVPKEVFDKYFGAENLEGIHSIHVLLDANVAEEESPEESQESQESEQIQIESESKDPTLVNTPRHVQPNPIDMAKKINLDNLPDILPRL